MAIDVTRDLEGLGQALDEVLNQDFAFSRVRRSFEESEGADRDHVLASLPPRTLSPGYYRWADYIVWLAERLKDGITVRYMDMCEVEGLVALDRARLRFDCDHPTCACGAHQESRFSQKCHSCGLEFRKHGAA
jgi:hypothetical protein